MHLLTGTIDGAVGKQIDGGSALPTVVERTPAAEDVFLKGLIGRCKGVEYIVFFAGITICCLAILIGGERHRLINTVVVEPATQTYGSTIYRLTARGIHAHELHLVVWKRFTVHINIAHIEQQALGGNGIVVGSQLCKIHSHGQAFYLDRVVRLLICRQADILPRVGEHWSLAYQMLYLGILVGIAHIALYVAVGIHRIHIECERLDVCYRHHLELGRHIGAHHLVVDAGVEIRQGELRLSIAQDIHPRPRAPVDEGVVDILHLFLGRRIIAACHEVVAFERHLTTLCDVLVFGDERVERLHIFRFAHLCAQVAAAFL